MATSPIYPVSAVAVSQDLRQGAKQKSLDFSQLVQALQDGNLAGAQQAYADLRRLQPVGQSSFQAASNRRGGGNSKSDTWKKLGEDLESGDLEAARTDLSQVQKDAQAVGARNGITAVNRRAQQEYGGGHNANSAAGNPNSSDGSTPQLIDLLA